MEGGRVEHSRILAVTARLTDSCYLCPMSIDVVDLRSFYSHRLGTVARRFVGRGVRARWDDTRGQRVLGIGYATPYLGLFREEAERCLAFMPATQGVVKWPSAHPSLSALVDETELPLPDAAVDRVLLVHAIENSRDVGALLLDVWRVLAAGGRLLAVVPNRRGVWARMDTTPFGHGRPYSRSQITASVARDRIHADALERSALCAADRTRLVPALGGGVGTHRRDDLGAVRRRPHCRGDEAGLSRGAGATREATSRSRARAGARAVAGRGGARPPSPVTRRR